MNAAHLFAKSGPDDAENELGDEVVLPQCGRGEGLACGGTQGEAGGWFAELHIVGGGTSCV